MTNPNEPIHPTSQSDSIEGLTKREYFAALFMQSLIARNEKYETSWAINAADDLIEELNKEKK